MGRVTIKRYDQGKDYDFSWTVAKFFEKKGYGFCEGEFELGTINRADSRTFDDHWYADRYFNKNYPIADFGITSKKHFEGAKESSGFWQHWARPPCYMIGRILLGTGFFHDFKVSKKWKMRIYDKADLDEFEKLANELANEYDVDIVLELKSSGRIACWENDGSD